MGNVCACDRLREQVAGLEQELKDTHNLYEVITNKRDEYRYRAEAAEANLSAEKAQHTITLGLYSDCIRERDQLRKLAQKVVDAFPRMSTWDEAEVYHPALCELKDALDREGER